MNRKQSQSKDSYGSACVPIQSQRSSVTSSGRIFHALRRQPSQARGLQRVVDVLDACERLLRGRRHDEIAMEDVAHEARIQIGSLYHFFPDRTAVLVSVLERVLVEEADAFKLHAGDADLELESYLREVQRRLEVIWRARLSVLDVYFAYQHHPLVWGAVMKLRARVARDVASKLLQLYPQLQRRRVTGVGEQIGIMLAVLNDNLPYVSQAQQRRLRRECLAMLVAYINAVKA